MNIRLIKQEDIDKTKYNSCVHFAMNGNVFGYMWYLNNVAKDWDVLVEDEYESVMPLVYRENFIQSKEIYVPSLTRELGLYSVNVLSGKRVKAFFNAIPEEYKKIHLSMNEGLVLRTEHEFDTLKKKNHQLLLTDPYEILASQYTTNTNEQLAKSRTADLISSSNVKPERVADFFKKYGKVDRNREHDFHAYQRIMYNALHRGVGFASGVLTQQEELCAVGFYIFSHNKIMSLLTLASPKGKELGALHFMTDLTIRTNAQRPLILDFNSTDNASLALDFDAKENHYLHLQMNKRKWKLI